MGLINFYCLFPELEERRFGFPYGVVGVSLEEFEVGVVQVLPAVEAFRRGGLWKSYFWSYQQIF